MGRKFAWFGGGAVVLIAVAVGVLWFLLQSSGAATVDNALEDFTAAPAAAAEPLDGAPAPGVYTYAVTGDERISRSALGISRSVTGEAPFIIRTVDGGYETELRYSQDHTEWVRYAIRDDGASAIWGQSEVKALGIGDRRPREWEPQPLRLPTNPEVGDTWAGSYKSGTLDIDMASDVLREDSVEIDGAQVPVVVIESVQTVRGVYSGGRTEEFWLDPESDLVVRYKIASDLEGPIDFSMTADHTLTSLTPQT